VTAALTLCYFQSGVTQISLGGVDIPYTQDFNTLASGGVTGSTMPANWVFLETGAGSNTTYAIDAGATSTENTYSYGTGSATERALGQINTATFSTIAGASFINNTGVNITSVLIQYFGEQWRLGALARADRIDFQYSTNATAINNGTWTNFDGLDFTGPIQAGSVGALDGNAAANRTLLSKTITGLSIANGATLWIRWNSFDATGSDDGLAIDDFALTANPSLHYTVSNIGVTLSITDTDGNGEGLYVSQQGTSIRFYAPGRTYSLNGGATTALPIDIPIAGLSFIVINAGTGNDTINVGAFTSNLPGFTINGGIDNDVVNMNGDIFLTSGAAFNADLTNDADPPGIDKFIVASNANLVCSGTGIATVKASHSVLLNSGSTIVTMNGNMVVEANQLSTPTSGNFIGLQLNANAFLEVLGTGAATIKGKGGNTGANNIGIFLSGGTIKGGMTGTQLNITGTGGVSTGNANHGVSLNGALAAIRAIGGSVNITGVAGGTGTSAANYGVHCVNSAAITTSGGLGSVTVNGTGGNCTGGNNIGVWVGVTATIASGVDNVIVTGIGGGGSGGAGTHNYGVYVLGGGKITCGGSGSVTVNGTGGTATGNANDGVTVYEANSLITSSGGAVNVTGQGGGTTTSGSNVGVHLQTSGMISAGNLGTVTVTGTGGATSGINNFGIFVIENGSAITSNNGNVTLNGIGGGSGSSTGNYGIIVFQGQVSAGGAGTVTMTGTGGSSSGTNNVGIRVSEVNGTVTSGGGDITMTGIEGSGPDGYAISVYSSGTVTTATNGGNITLIGNSMHIAATISTNAAQGIAIHQYTDAVDMNLGPATNPIGGPLNLSDTELDFISTSTLLLGQSATTGTFTISSSITRSALTHIGMYSNEDLIINGGSINTNGGIVVFDPGDSPDAVQAIQAGVDATVDIAYPVGDLLINITGIVADVSYTQFNVVGGVNLNFASLTFSGSYDPQPGDVFTIVLNDGVDAITGTFSGLAQGATITSFLGSDLPATISYIGGTGNDVVITVGSPNYILTNTGGILSLVDFTGNGETLSISQFGTNIRFDVLTRTYSLNGGAVTNFPIDIAIAGLTSITADAAVGNDVINVGAFVTSLPSMTLNGGTGDESINFNGDITFVANASLNVDLQNDDPAPGADMVSFAASVNIQLLGNGISTIRVSRNILMAASSSIVTVNGAMTIEANQQVTPSTGTFNGISLASGALIQTTGSGILTVKGKGGTSGGNQNGINIVSGDIIGGTTGTTIIEGRGGITTGNTNTGVTVSSAGASISTSGSHLNLTGFGGGSVSALVNLGVNVGAGGIISAGGSGSVTITGTGGNSSANFNEGIRVDGATITSSGGSVTVTGSGGGSGGSSYGVSIQNTGLITAGVTGAVSVQGTGGVGSGNFNHGVYLSSSNSKITGTAGTLNVLGQGGGSGATESNYGVYCSGSISSSSSGTVNVQGAGGMTTGLANVGVAVRGLNSIITSLGGSVTVSGLGGGIGSSAINYGVYVENQGKISAGSSGVVTVNGTGGTTTGSSNHGVVVLINGAIITSSGGNVFVTGQGGGSGMSASNIGVVVQQTGIVSAGGAGQVNITGTGGNTLGSNNIGVYVWFDNSLITSAGGNVTVTGTANGVGGGGGGGNGSSGVGVYVVDGKITAGGNGTVNISGYGSLSSGIDNHGVRIEGSTGTVTTSGGNVLISGMQGGSASSYGIILQGNAEINTATNGGSIRLKANSMSLAGLIATGLPYYTWLEPLTNGVDINLGTVGDANIGPLNLSDPELDSITTGYLILGGPNAGDITTTADITRTASTNVTLNSADDILISVGSIHTGGSDLTLIPGLAPDAVYPLKSGTEVICNTLYPIGPIEFDIDGLVADVGYTQMNLTGSINLEDASLQLTGLHVPQAGETFILINNDGVDAVLNTFVGLAEGATITSFLGGAYPATISYVGGTGNDVVITVSSPHYLLSTTGNEIIFTDVAGNGETITMNQSGISNIEYVVPGRNYSLNGGVITALPVVAGMQAMNMVTINAGGGNDGIVVNAFTGNMCHLTLNGGIGNDVVTMNGDIVFATNANLNIDLQNDDPVPGDDIIQLSANTNLPLVALGIATFKCSRSITFNAGSSLTTVNGNLTLEANQQATPTTGAFYGIFQADNSLVEVTGAGTLDVKGKGGTSSNAQIGVYLYNSAILRGGPAGNHFVNGTGGATTSNDNRGIQVQLNAIMTTNGGNLFLTAQGGGTGASAHNHGMHVVQGGVITAGGMGNVTINTFGGLPTGVRNHGIHVYGAGSIITSNGGNVHVFGQSGGTGISSYNHGVFVEDFATITAGGLGTVTIEGNGGDAEGERNDGVICYRPGATITSGGGDVNVTGIGGGTGASAYNYGVFLDNGGIITAGGMGELHVHGTGGASTGTRNAGVFVYLQNSFINTSGGDAYVTGQGGGSGSSNENFGVFVFNGATISAGGAGNVFVNGTGGNTTGTRNDGVLVEGDTAIITSSGGHVEVIGQGAGNGVAFRNYGVFANNTGVITAGVTGNVHVEGTGAAAAEGVRNYGVVVANPGSMITGSGAITVIGQGGGSGVNSNNNFGTYLTAGSIIAEGNGTIDIEGTGGNAEGPYNFGVFSIGTSTITTANGNIDIVGHGGGVDASANNNGIRMDAVIMAGGSGQVNVEGYGGSTTGINNYGIVMEGGLSEITTNAGNITVFGQGLGSGGLELGVYMGGGAQIISGGMGTTSVEGIGGHNAAATNYGIYMQSVGTLISSGGGDVTITGYGGGGLGGGSNNYGIDVVAGAEISAGGNGNVTLHGTGGASSGTNNYGVVIYSGSPKVTSSGGDIHILAQGGGTGAGGSNIGFHLQSTGMIAAGGTGDILIEGNGGDALGNGNHGALIFVNGTSVTTVDGDIEIIGTGGGTGSSSSNIGIEVNDGMIHAGGTGVISLQGSGAMTAGALNNGVTINGPQGLVSTSNGTISVTGVPGSDTNAFGIIHSNGAQIRTQTGGGNIELLANSIHIQSGIATLPADTVFISSLSIDTSIELGSVTDPIFGPLMLSDAELDSITTGTLIIGRNTAGTITVVDTISREVATVVNLVSGGDVIFDGGLLSANGGNVVLDPGNSPAAVLPIQYGNDVSCGILSFGSDLLIDINGVVADTLHDQLNIIGVIDLSGVELELIGSYTPMDGDSFVIVHNDGIDMIISTFNGWAEGDTLFNFLGGTLDAVITYVGGDGNDVVIRLEQSCIAPSDVVISASADTICQGTAITLQLESGNLGGATEWHWYSNSCGGNPVGTGTSIIVTPTDTTTYYVRGEGGCVVNDNCTATTIVAHPFPDATIYQEFSDTCYFINRLFRPEQVEIPGATYLWDFGPTAVPPTASGYGPHIVYYDSIGPKSVQLVIYPNASGAQCADSSTVEFIIYLCPGQVVGIVRSEIGNPIAGVNVRLYTDTDTNGEADNQIPIRSVFTSSTGGFALASLTPGSYVLTETQPAGWLSLDDGDDSDDGDIVANLDSLDNLIPVTIVPRELDSINIFVERPVPGNITGSVFHDFDIDQSPDAGEGLAAVSIQLFPDINGNGVADTNEPYATTMTNGAGEYSFMNIPVGHYVLVELQVPGFISVKDLDPSNDNDLVPNTNMTNDTLPVTLTNGELDANNYFIDIPECGTTVTNTFDAGPGSLRNALACGESGDTIRFHPVLTGMTIDITSDMLHISNDLVILSELSPVVTIASFINGLIEVEEDVEVELRDIKLISGLSPGLTGAAIENHGHLTLHNITVVRNPLFVSGEYLIRNQGDGEINISGVCNLKFNP